MINTICNKSYNKKEREAFWLALENAKRIRDEFDDYMDSLSDDEYTERKDDLISEYQKLDSEVRKAIVRCFAAQFHKCRNEWFASVIDGFAEGTTQITEKQYHAFAKYCCDEDADAWKTKQMYCRVGDFFITLTWKNSNRSITKENLL